MAKTKSKATPRRGGKKILVLHGPNLNLFGRREPHIYGTTTLPEINARLLALAAELDVELAVTQSNHEGVLIDFLHTHIDSAQGALINPAGLTQHGVPLHDAIKAMPFPSLEVHLSNIHRREPYRNHSYVSKGATGIIMGLGAQGYLRAVDAIAEIRKVKK